MITAKRLSAAFLAAVLFASSVMSAGCGKKKQEGKVSAEDPWFSATKILRGFIRSLCALRVFPSVCCGEPGREGGKYPWELQKLPFQRILEILYRTRDSGLCDQSENRDPLWNTY